MRHAEFSKAQCTSVACICSRVVKVRRVRLVDTEVKRQSARSCVDFSIGCSRQCKRSAKQILTDNNISVLCFRRRRHVQIGGCRDSVLVLLQARVSFCCSNDGCVDLRVRTVRSIINAVNRKILCGRARAVHDDSDTMTVKFKICIIIRRMFREDIGADSRRAK